jgi:hypothetical protein
MENDFVMLDLQSLRRLHAIEVEALKQGLINGATWEEVQELRHKIIKIEVAIDKKQRSQNVTTTPASTSSFAAN